MPILFFGLLLIVGGFLVTREALADVPPSEQGGNFSEDFDGEFLDVSKKRGVPFALLKAHALAESSLDPTVITPETVKGQVANSYGLMQLLWWSGSNRWSQFGMSDAEISDGTPLLDPHTNIDLAAQLIKSNLRQASGNVRDAISIYNSGHAETDGTTAYVDKVIGYYQTILKRSLA